MCVPVRLCMCVCVCSIKIRLLLCFRLILANTISRRGWGFSINFSSASSPLTSHMAASGSKKRRRTLRIANGKPRNGIVKLAKVKPTLTWNTIIIVVVVVVIVAAPWAHAPHIHFDFFFLSFHFAKRFCCVFWIDFHSLRWRAQTEKKRKNKSGKIRIGFSGRFFALLCIGAIPSVHNNSFYSISTPLSSSLSLSSILEARI